jgi:hypothetical protein
MIISFRLAPDSPLRRRAEEVAFNFMAAILFGPGARRNWMEALRRTSDWDSCLIGNVMFDRYLRAGDRL